MSTTQPIRNGEDVQKLLNYYEQEKPNLRNYTLIICGLHTALRISDLLSLRWENVYNFKKQRYVTHLHVYEKKTGKHSVLALNHHVIQALEEYRNFRMPQPQDYIFSKTTNPAHPLCRSQAYRIVKKAAEATLDDTHISCHSLRKTFGYHAWKRGTSPVLIMDVYNHSSFVITRRYLGIDQDDRDTLFKELDF